MMHIPSENKYLPNIDLDATRLLVPKLANEAPTLAMQSTKLSCWLGTDHVHLKPVVHLKLVFMFDQTTITDFLNTPKQTALFTVMSDCLIETVNKEFGYEANMADISYSAGNWLDNLGLKVKFEGYSGEELLRFGELFIERMM